MISADVSGIVQASSLTSIVTSNPYAPGENAPGGTTSSGTGARGNAAPVPADTVTLSRPPEKPADVVTAKDAEKETRKPEAPDKKNQKYDWAIAQVQFLYDLRGELIIRFTDTARRLIYQVPSELMIRMSEAAAKSGKPVSTKV